MATRYNVTKIFLMENESVLIALGPIDKSLIFSAPVEGKARDGAREMDVVHSTT